MREMKDSGIQWIGEIPKEWEVIKNKYLITMLYSGGTPNATNEMILSISLDTFSTQNSKQVRNPLFEMEKIYMERSGMDIFSISVAA